MTYKVGDIIYDEDWNKYGTILSVKNYSNKKDLQYDQIIQVVWNEAEYQMISFVPSFTTRLIHRDDPEKTAIAKIFNN